MTELPSHLGGHGSITHLDTASLLYLKNKYDIKTSYDLGCGPGGMVKAMIDNGIDAVGVDGDFTIKRSVPCVLHDFCTGPVELDPRDFCWSVEFLEHVEEQYMDNYFSVFNQCKVILCTASQNPHAYHHVNVKPIEYWVEKFKERGFTLSEEDTEYIRANSSMKRDFIKETGMVYIKD